MRRSLLLLAAVLVLDAGCPAPPPPAGPSFRSEVRPLLADACFGCHGRDEKRRKGDVRLDTREGARAAVVPGDLEKSLLWKRVSSAHVDDRMPPPDSNRTLTPAQVDVLRRWILAGAPWEEHWAYAPVKPPPVPPLPAWGRNEIDAFVGARLAAEGLAPSPGADRPTLARRLALDLTGLPPTPEEVDAFVADVAPGAVDRLADRLLASPRYGEHMARHWMDLARCGDTQGLAVDSHREMWPYRDWVIRAFNANLRYDRFVREQLAGDLLPGENQDAKIASGFNRAHLVTGEGGTIEEEAMCRNVFDRVETFGQVFLGLSLSCARCHDHKFDPIAQKEYYGLFAFFNNLDGPERSWNTKGSPPSFLVFSPAQRAELDRISVEATARESRLIRPDPAADALQASWERDLAARLASQWAPLTPIRRSETPSEVTLEFSLGAAAHGLRIDGPAPRGIEVHGPGGRLPMRAVAAAGGPPSRAYLVSPAPFGPGPIRLRLPLAGAPEPGVAVASTTDAELLGGAMPARRSPWWSLGPVPAEDEPSAAADRDSPGTDADLSRPWKGLPWVRRDGWSDGAEIPLPAVLGASFALRTIESPSPRTLKVRIAGDDALELWLNGRLVHARSGRRVLDRQTPDEVALDLKRGENRLLLKFSNYGTAVPPRFAFEVADEGADDLLLAEAGILAIESSRRSEEQRKTLRNRFRRESWPEYPVLAREIADLRRSAVWIIDAVPSALVMRERATPRDAWILERGDYERRGEKVARHTPAILPAFPAGAPLDRRGLADWIVQPGFPLTARVAVNRLWQQCFGDGLVRTAGDFGVQGEPPSHPELLDWLADRLVADGWDLKAALRRIVGSAVYAQSSRITPDVARRDPENRLLARGPRHRLDAEVLRDQALLLGGLLVERIGGASVKAPQPAGLWESVSFSTSDTARFVRDREPGKVFRRSLYLYWKRTAPPPQMALLDAPSRESCVTRRERTQTPLQALVLLNEPQYAEAARHLAQKAILEGGSTAESRAAWMLRRCTLRPALPEDVADLVALARSRQAAFARDPDAARKAAAFGDLAPDPSLDPAELSAWTAAAAVVLNLDDVVSRR